MEVDGCSRVGVFERVGYFARLIGETLREKGFGAVGISGVGVLGVFFSVVGRVMSKVMVNFGFF